jgi:hypothetical protein
MKKDNSINDTLNEILFTVISGADYVSKVALETNKSIPVVHRQLDVLVNFGLLIRQRAGKRVSYSVNWMNLSDMISSAIMLDIEKFRKITKASEKETILLNEIDNLLKKIPAEVLNNKTEMNKLVASFFNEKPTRELFKRYVIECNKSVKYLQKNMKMDLDENIELFLEMFGMITIEKQKELLGVEAYKRNKVFLDYCRARYLQRKALDPRSGIIEMNI